MSKSEWKFSGYSRLRNQATFPLGSLRSQKISEQEGTLRIKSGELPHVRNRRMEATPRALHIKHKTAASPDFSPGLLLPMRASVALFPLRISVPPPSLCTLPSLP